MSMIHDITARAPRYKRGTRKGRGSSSGHGKTAGRGTKGSGARGGGPHWKPGHEGGQTPIHRRLPTRGFSNDEFARNWYIVNIGQLERFADGATVDAAALVQARLVPDTKLPVKILGDGQFSRRLTVLAGWYSRSAHQRITAAGGSAQNAKGEAFVFPKPKFKPAPKPEKEGKQAKGKPKEKPAQGEAAEKPAQHPAQAAPAAEQPAPQLEASAEQRPADEKPT